MTSVVSLNRHISPMTDNSLLNTLISYFFELSFPLSRNCQEILQEDKLLSSDMRNNTCAISNNAISVNHVSKPIGAHSQASGNAFL